jgi:hypothetical protein
MTFLRKGLQPMIWHINYPWWRTLEAETRLVSNAKLLKHGYIRRYIHVTYWMYYECVALDMGA